VQNRGARDRCQELRGGLLPTFFIVFGNAISALEVKSLPKKPKIEVSRDGFALFSEFEKE